MPIRQKREAKGSRVWRQERHQHLPFKICAEGTKTALRNDHYLDLRRAKSLLERAGVAKTTDATGGHCTAPIFPAESYRSGEQVRCTVRQTARRRASIDQARHRVTNRML